MMSSPAQVVDALGPAAGAATDLAVPESLQAQVENLQNLVKAFMQKVQEQQDWIVELECRKEDSFETASAGATSSTSAKSARR